MQAGPICGSMAAVTCSKADDGVTAHLLSQSVPAVYDMPIQVKKCCEQPVLPWSIVMF